MKKIADEYDILYIFVEDMESKGVRRNMVYHNLDEAFLERMKKRVKHIDLKSLHNLADRCLANEWLEHTTLGSGQYGDLCLTTSGFGVVRSLRAKERQLSNRTPSKKVSDFIVDHKGIFVLVGVVIAFATLIVNLTKKN